MPLDFGVKATAKTAFISASSVINVKPENLLNFIAEGKIAIDPTAPTSVVEARRGNAIGLTIGNGPRRVSMIIENMTMKEWEKIRGDIISSKGKKRTIDLAFGR
jgi:hypothetical protein